MKESRETKSQLKPASSIMKVSLISSLITSIVFISCGYAFYEFCVKDSFATKSDLNIESMNLKASLKKDENVKANNFKTLFIPKKTFDESLEKIRADIKTSQNSNTTSLNDLQKMVSDIKISMSTYNERLGQAEEQNLSTINNMNQALANISSSSVKDNTARAGIVVAIKKAEELESKFDHELNKISRENKANTGDVILRVNELKANMLSKLDDIYVQTDKGRRQNEDLLKRYKEISRSMSKFPSVKKEKERTVSNALGIDIEKGTGKPIYNLRAIINNKVFINVEKNPQKPQNVRFFVVGDYIDGYGKIVSISSKNGEVMTENGKIIFR